MTTIVARASESLHWYQRDGTPQYTVKAKNGNERATTLADARKMNLVPSVTTILNVAAKPGLERWKQEQLLLAVMTLPRAQDEDEKSFIDRVVVDSKEQGKRAAERGTRIHEAVESFYNGVMLAEMAEYQVGVYNEIEKVYDVTRFEPEKAFAHELGFGGKVDLHTRKYKDAGLVLDIKSKEFTDPSKVDAYDEHMMQLAAYRVGLDLPNAVCANVFVSATKPGLVIIKEWSQDDLARGWEMFQSLLRFWQIKNQHR
jgi:hypothetical protein